MTPNALSTLLQQVASGELSPAAAQEQLAQLPFKELGHSTRDRHSELRQGMPESVYGENKTVESTTILTTGQITTATRSHTKNLGVTPRATYNFSRKLQGSLDISYSRRQDLQRDRTAPTISVSLEALIQF